MWITLTCVNLIEAGQCNPQKAAEDQRKESKRLSNNPLVQLINNASCSSGFSLLFVLANQIERYKRGAGARDDGKNLWAFVASPTYLLQVNTSCMGGALLLLPPSRKLLSVCKKAARIKVLCEDKMNEDFWSLWMVDIVDFGHLVIDIRLQLIHFLFLKWIQSASSWMKRSLVK